MCSLQSVLWRTGVKGYRWQITKAQLSGQGWYWTENQEQETKDNSFVNRTIRLWNQLPAEILRTLPCKPNAFRKRVRKVINVVNWGKGVLKLSKSVVKWSKVKWSEGQCSESGAYREGYLWVAKWSEMKVMLKLVCSTCGETILETRCSTFFPLCCFSYAHCY